MKNTEGPVMATDTSTAWETWFPSAPESFNFTSTEGLFSKWIYLRQKLLCVYHSHNT